MFRSTRVDSQHSERVGRPSVALLRSGLEELRGVDRVLDGANAIEIIFGEAIDGVQIPELGSLKMCLVEIVSFVTKDETWLA